MTHRTLLRLIVVAAAIAAGGVCRVQAQEEPPKPELILQQMLAAYSDAQTYSDRSTVRYLNPDGSERLKVDVRILLARPVAFRIDATTTSPQGGKMPRREVLWTDGSAVRTWATDKPVQTRPKVQLVGSRMFGTYAYHVPTLLEAKYGGAKRLVNLDSPKLVGVENFEGVECYRVSGGFNGDPYEIWIGRADHLIRKIHAKYRDHQMEEIHRDIAVNQPIAFGDFRFRPEEEVAPQESSPSPAKRSR
jgi:outer membrane lipoprotein-sorting protein